MTMNSQSIEALKKRYTGRRVKLDTRWPELPQFRDVPGQIMAINYSGHALVQFEGADSGWHDIDLGYLQPLDRRDAETVPPPI